MIYRTLRFSMLLVLLATALGAQTNVSSTPREAADPGMISVTGVGTVQLAPDRSIFTVGVETSAPNVADAVQQNNQRTAAVIAALRRAGVAETEIRTSNYSVMPQYDYSSGGQRPRLIGFQATNNVTVTRKSITEIGRLLQASIDAGANTIGGVSFSVADQTRGREEGLRRAFDDAKTKASLLARNAGRNLGRAVSITEGSAPPPDRPMYGKVAAMEARSAAVDVPIESGTDELRFTVSVIFEMQ